MQYLVLINAYYVTAFEPFCEAEFSLPHLIFIQSKGPGCTPPAPALKGSLNDKVYEFNCRHHLWKFAFFFHVSHSQDGNDELMTTFRNALLTIAQSHSFASAHVFFLCSLKIICSLRINENHYQWINVLYKESS